MDDIQTASELRTAIEEARTLAREQVAAAWQLHVDRIREELESGWRERLDSIFDDRFAEVESRLGATLKAVMEDRLRDSRNEVTSALNQTARRLRAAESREEWIRTMIEAADRFCGKAAVIAITGKALSIGDQPPVALAAAPAVANAVESKDTVVAVGTPRELSTALSAAIGDASSKKIYLFPIVVRQTVVAVLYAEPAERPVDVSAMELLASL